MEPLRRSRWSVAGATVALVAIAALGNLRGVASETRGGATPSSVLVGRIDPVFVDENGTSETSASADDQDPAVDDQARLIPAIYAWDPDVRFVYYRHVSKWM